MDGPEPGSIGELTKELTGRLMAIVSDGGDWKASSPCDGWTAQDVLEHLIETERDFLVRHDVALEPLPDDEPQVRWADHANQVVSAMQDADFVATKFHGMFGPTTVGETFSAFYCFDLVVHRWDIARGLGTTTSLDDNELDLVEAMLDTAGEALYSEGTCDEPVDLPGGASREEQVLALTGRDPRG